MFTNSEDQVGRDSDAGRLLVVARIGSAHDEAEPQALKAAAWHWWPPGIWKLDLSIGPAGVDSLLLTSPRMGKLVGTFERAYQLPGVKDMASGDDAFRLALPA